METCRDEEADDASRLHSIMFFRAPNIDLEQFSFFHLINRCAMYNEALVLGLDGNGLFTAYNC